MAQSESKPQPNRGPKTQHIEVSADDLRWLEENYPNLKVTGKKPLVIEGRLDLTVAYDTSAKEYVLYPDTDLDTAMPVDYGIRVVFQTSTNSLLPRVYETDDKIRAVAKKLGKQPADIEAWEQGKKSPTVRQARELAGYYDRPFLEFFLDLPPELTVPDLVPDYRMHAGQVPRQDLPAADRARG